MRVPRRFLFDDRADERGIELVRSGSGTCERDEISGWRHGGKAARAIEAEYLLLENQRREMRCAPQSVILSVDKPMRVAYKLHMDALHMRKFRSS